MKHKVATQGTRTLYAETRSPDSPAWIVDVRKGTETKLDVSVGSVLNRGYWVLEPDDPANPIIKSGPLSGSFGNAKNHKKKRVKRLKRERGYKEPRPALGDKKKRRRKKKKAEKPVFGSIVKHYGPGPHKSGTPQSIHGNWSRGTSARQILREMTERGGFTIDVPTGKKPSKGWSVAVAGHEDHRPAARMTESWVRKYRQENNDAFSRDRAKWGGWVETPEGRPSEGYFDVAVVHESFADAVKLARSSNQIAIFNLETFEEVAMSDKGRIAELLEEEQSGRLATSLRNEEES